jgi:pimeloyl-ACP methyl ester carboxylesterase
LLQTGVVVELRQIEVDRRPVRCRVVGAGQDVLVVHGLSGSWRWWLPLVETLSERSRLHLVELPRLGRLRAGEMAPWLGRLLDAVGLGPVDVLAHSLGGLVATELAIEQPNRVRRLVLVAPAGIPCGRGVLARTLPLLEELYDVRTRLPTLVSDAVRTGPVSLVHGVAYVWERDIRGELGAVQAPTLLVWGERDRLVPAWIAEEWQRLLPRSRLVRLPCGHVPMWEAPRELATCVLAFLGEQLPDDSGEQAGLGVGNRVRLAGNDDQAATR